MAAANHEARLQQLENDLAEVQLWLSDPDTLSEAKQAELRQQRQEIAEAIDEAQRVLVLTPPRPSATECSAVQCSAVQLFLCFLRDPVPFGPLIDRLVRRSRCVRYSRLGVLAISLSRSTAQACWSSSSSSSWRTGRGCGS